MTPEQRLDAADFDAFWKQSGWYSENPELYEGTSEYSLAQDAWNAGRDAFQAKAKKAMESLRVDVINLRRQSVPLNSPEDTARNNGIALVSIAISATIAALFLEENL